MISFQCKTKDIKATLKMLKGVHKHKHIIGINVTCEITLTDGNVQLAIPGAIFNFKCQSKGTAKATMEFRKLYNLIDHHSYDELYVEFFDGSLRFGSVIVEAKTIFFKNDSVLKTIDLADKYTDLDLLLMKNEGYTKEELEFNNLSGIIEMAERRVYYNVRRSAGYLREYGITPQEIKNLLMEKLGIRLDLDEKDMKVLLAKD
jgi:hypothetical protein